MELTSASSIFRCMPKLLPVSFRRLLTSFAYAVDGVELSYSRLHETALNYELRPEAECEGQIWPATYRHCILLDAWSVIDNVSRARKLVSRFPWEKAQLSAQLKTFLRETKSAAALRHQLFQIEEESLAGTDATEGHAVLGTVDWIDTRRTGEVTRYAVSSGMNTDVDRFLIPVVPDLNEVPGVKEFRLSVADKQADIDALRACVRSFARDLEASVADSVSNAVRREAEKRSAAVALLCESALADMTVAARFQIESAEVRRLIGPTSHSWPEVLPNTYRVRDC
ncbi:MAG: hypothetical protein ACJ8EY_00515 [Sphingomicrobium sp.]